MANVKRYEVTVDYVTCTTVLVDALDEMEASEAVYAYLGTTSGMRDMLNRMADSPNASVDAFEVSDVSESSAIGSDVIRASECLGCYDGDTMKAIFDSHGADSELKGRDGSTVEVIGPLDPSEYDEADTGLMYRIRFEDGRMSDAFADELTKQ